MSKIRFKQFVGENYHKQDFKIFVLGESHYLKDSELEAYNNNDKFIEEITINVLRRFFNYKKHKKDFERWMNTFTKFSNVLGGKKMTSSETLVFWENCSFYNYVQSPTTGPRISPTGTEFKNSKNAFLCVLGETKPDIIFVWGYRLWNNLPKEELYNKINFQNTEIHFFNKIPIKVLPHPSSNKFNYKLSNEIDKYIDEIKNMNENKNRK